VVQAKRPAASLEKETAYVLRRTTRDACNRLVPYRPFSFVFTLMLRSRMLRRLCQVTCGTALLVLLLPAATVYAQEFECNVNVDYTQLQGSDYSFLNELDRRIAEYINDNVWTEDRFDDVERIDCEIDLTLDAAVSLTSFRGQLAVSMRRPIYGTSQATTVIQFLDSDLAFNYTQGTSLTLDLERHEPLTSVLNFYVYLMLGYDYDTFSEFGGTRHFATARRIAERGQNSGAPGWLAVGGDQGRMNLVSQILDARYRPLRQAYFTYHFGGLDHFVVETDAARQRVFAMLQTLRELQQNVSRSYAIDAFFTAKYAELTAVFAGSNLSNQAYQLLSQVDPSHMSKYNELVQ
jgi:hypothetical protein